MFIIHTKTGIYKVRMRAAYSYIRSEKAYRELIQRIIDQYKYKPAWERYALALQEKLNKNDLHEINSLLGHWNYSKKIE